VTTFHRLCEELGGQAGTLAERPSPIPQEWWDAMVPKALEDALDVMPDERFHAVVVDEGQDFDVAWLTLLQLLLVDPDHDVLWVFHDPGQALYRPDRVAELGLERLELFDNHRNPEPVAELAARFYHGGDRPTPSREGGLEARVIEATAGAATVEAVRKELHRLTHDEGVPEYRIAVLSGHTAAKSDVWKQQRFGNVELWNGALEPDGRSKGLPPEEVPDEPPDALLFETIRRFKGLERDVVILAELPTEGERLDELLYVGLTRATTSLTVITPPELAARFRP
jgi:superfamily I DNA/RNA helicase